MNNIDNTYWNCPKCMAILSEENPKCACGYPTEDDCIIWSPSMPPTEPIILPSFEEINGTFVKVY